MDNEERRSILRSITDEQYDDIINVLSIYPHITMNVSCGVFDDEDEHIITTGAVVTLTIRLQRENMSTVFNKEIGSNTSTTLNTLDDEANEEQPDDKENREKTNETSKAVAAAAKGWSNKSDKKKKAKKKGQATPSKTTNTSLNKQQSTAVNINKKQGKTEEKESSDDDSSKHSDDSPSTLRHRHEQSKDETNNTDNENNDEENPSKKSRKNSDNDEDTFLERFQQQQRKREKLETKAKISHRVFCPFYPEIKQECWWLYVADRKHYSLISAPVNLCTLKDKEEVEVKFSAPKIPGHYVYSVILRSDSYFDVDAIENLAFDVQAAKEMDNNHPQWNFSEEEGAANNKAEDEEFATESDSD